MLRDMVARWEQAAADIDLEAGAEALGYTPHEMMTIASLIEAEGRGDYTPKIARVIYNRLEITPTGAPGLLQIDATVNYALGRTGIARLTTERRSTRSRTRRTTPTPSRACRPAPIEAPGRRAMEAALNPADGDWFFYVTVNLATGRDQVRRQLRRVPGVQGRAAGVLRDPVRPVLSGGPADEVRGPRRPDRPLAVAGDPPAPPTRRSGWTTGGTTRCRCRPAGWRRSSTASTRPSGAGCR